MALNHRRTRPPTLRRSKQRSAFGGVLSQLAAKYGGSEENEPFNEPSEEEFLAARQRLEARRGGSSTAGGAGGGGSKPAKRAKK